MSNNDSEVIDVFNHVYPQEYLDALPHPLSPYIARWVSASKGFTDMEYRIKLLDKLGIDKQAISLARPTIEDTGIEAGSLNNISRAANNGIAKIVEKHPDRFLGVGTLSLHNVDEAIEELDRCVEDLGLLGVQVLTNVGGKPLDSREFEPFYERLSHHDAAVWIHPTDMRKTYDWVNEGNLNMILGWGVESSLAMFRIVRGGLFERYPNLKVITHHMGVMIPFYAGRIDRTIMLEGKDGAPPEPLKKRPMDYLKMFYVDTAEGSWKPALVCSQMFYGSDKLLFASDYPFTGESGPLEIIDTVGDLDVSEEDKRKILGQNAKKLFNIK